MRAESLRLLDMQQLGREERTLLPPFEHHDVTIHGLYSTVVRPDFINDAFPTGERYCRSCQNLDAVSNYEFMHKTAYSV